MNYYQLIEDYCNYNANNLVDWCTKGNSIIIKYNREDDTNEFTEEVPLIDLICFSYNRIREECTD